MRVVVALGGNALLRRDEIPTAQAQGRNVAAAVRALAPLVREHDVVITHGNGPQVGLMALQAGRLGGDWPLDVLGAESDGMIGYQLERELSSRLPQRRFAALLTQVVVDPADPAFARPSKPIGPVYGAEEGRRLAATLGWALAPETGGKGVRRVVPSPRPVRIVEIDTIRYLVDGGFVVICAGGGGIPVTVGDDGALRGIEAVIDKDFTAALLARDIAANALLLLTDVAGIYRDFAKPNATLRRDVGISDLAGLALPSGSMGPKAAAAAAFAAGGGFAAIGAMEDAAAVLAGHAGTRLRA